MSYVQFGFLVEPETESNEDPIPIRVVFTKKKTLSNQSAKPSLLKRHRQTKYPETINKPFEFFQIKLTYLKK